MSVYIFHQLNVGPNTVQLPRCILTFISQIQPSYKAIENLSPDSARLDNTAPRISSNYILSITRVPIICRSNLAVAYRSIKATRSIILHDLWYPYGSAALKNYAYNIWHRNTLWHNCIRFSRTLLRNFLKCYSISLDNLYKLSQHKLLLS